MADRSLSIPEEYPELYGTLLIADERIENSGSLVVWIVLLGTLGFIIAIHLRWLDTVAGIPFQRLRHWEAYTLIVAMGFTAITMIGDALEKRTYRSIRPRIVQLLTERRISVDLLVAHFAKSAELPHVCKYIKNDRTLEKDTRVPSLF